MNNFTFFTRSLLLIVPVLILNGCDKHAGNDTAEYLLTGVYYYGKQQQSHEYNGAGLVTRSTYTTDDNVSTKYSRIVEYTYNGDNRVEQTKTYYHNLNAEAYNTNYIYDSQGRLVQTLSTLVTNGAPYLKDTYNYDGHTIVKKHFDYENTSPSYVCTYTMDDRGNIVQDVMDDLLSANNDYTETWLDYDDQKNVRGPGVGDVMSKNNPRRHIITAPRTSDTEYSLAYDYNGAGYVTKVKTNRKGDNYITITNYEQTPKP
ncbi:MAG TPA: hypothetical protein VIM79_22860 [Niastella sp.]